MKIIGKFIGLYFAIVIFIYGIFPLGITAFISGWLVYGSFESALVFYASQMGMAATSIMGLIPIYGIKLHFIFVNNNIFPWAISHGLSLSWLFSVSGLLSGILGAICPGALILKLFEDKMDSGIGSNIILILALLFAIIGSIYSGILFFSV